MGSDDTQTIRVEAGEKIGSFKQETVNNIVRVKGKLVEDRIDEAYLAQWEEMLKSQTARSMETTKPVVLPNKKPREKRWLPLNRKELKISGNVLLNGKKKKEKIIFRFII